MKHTKIFTIAVLATSLLLPLSVQANGWQVLPVSKPGYKPDVAAAVIVGVMQAKDENVDIFAPAGVEVSLNCPLLKAPKHTIRQQVSYTHSEKNGFKAQSFELSPHHMFKTRTNKLTVGVGPTIGYTMVENKQGDDGIFTFGIGASSRYDITKQVFIGAQARYVKAQEFEIAGKKTGFDNAKAVVKLGYQF